MKTEQAARLLDLFRKKRSLENDLGALRNKIEAVDREYATLRDEVAKSVGRNMPTKVWRVEEFNIVAQYRETGSSVEFVRSEDK